MDKVALRPVLVRCVRVHALAEPADSAEEAVRRPAGIDGASPTYYLAAAARMRGSRGEPLQGLLGFSRVMKVRVPRHSTTADGTGSRRL